MTLTEEQLDIIQQASYTIECLAILLSWFSVVYDEPAQGMACAETVANYMVDEVKKITTMF